MKIVGKALSLIQTLRSKQSGAPNAAPEEQRTTNHPDLSMPSESVESAKVVQADGGSEAVSAQALLREALKPAKPGETSRAKRLADALHAVLHAHLEDETVNNHEISVTAPRSIREPNFPTRGPVPRAPSVSSYYRWHASTATLCLSLRAVEACVEIFLMQADEIALLSFSEFGSRLKVRFDLTKIGDDSVWLLGKAPATSESVELLIQQCLLDLCKTPEPSLDDSKSTRYGSERSNNDSVQQLMLEKENLIFKVLNQQENIKTDLARSLHDTVLADLLMLKRHMRGDQELSKDEIIETIEEIAQQLRDICNECAPRNLHDWGLKVSLQDLLNRFAQRTAINCRFQCETDIPNLPDTVELHIFRLFQEALNNIEKHAKATSVNIYVEEGKDNSVRFRVVDNGKGFLSGQSERSLDSGGMGVKGMRERAQLIRCFYPTEFSLQSQPDAGTTVTLELTIPT